MIDSKFDQELTAAWLGRRLPSIIAILEQSLKEVDFNVNTKTEGDSILTHVAYQGKHRGTIDTAKILADIIIDDGGYDWNLEDPVYEAAKIARIIRQRVAVINILFKENHEVAIQKLSELSGDNDVKFVIIN